MKGIEMQEETVPLNRFAETCTHSLGVRMTVNHVVRAIKKGWISDLHTVVDDGVYAIKANSVTQAVEQLRSGCVPLQKRIKTSKGESRNDKTDCNLGEEGKAGILTTRQVASRVSETVGAKVDPAWIANAISKKFVPEWCADRLGGFYVVKQEAVPEFEKAVRNHDRRFKPRSARGNHGIWPLMSIAKKSETRNVMPNRRGNFPSCDGERNCHYCGKILGESNKTKHQAGARRHCDGCVSEYRKTLRARRVKATYGLDWGQYESLFEKQGGKCAICQKNLVLFENSPTDYSARVDHCHDTGRVRGLLCNGCNSGLGYFMDNAEFLLGAIEYLKSPPAYTSVDAPGLSV